MCLEHKHVRAEEQEIDNDEDVETLSQALLSGYVQHSKSKRQATQS